MKLVIGFITYNNITAKYLPYFLSSLKNQSFKDYSILAVDNSEIKDNENVRFIKKHYPEIDVEWAVGNIGFARAHNKMIRKAVQASAKYFLAINSDMILEKNAVELMIKKLDTDNDLGSVSPKILRWDFTNNEKTDIIDSCGIKQVSALRFVDVGQNDTDKGQFDSKNIIGPSGAAAMYRVSALENVKKNDQYFDELMFMYKEDADMAYRLNQAGFGSNLVPKAIIYHDRTAAGKGESDWQIARNRKNKSKRVKKWSFLNQHIIFLKYWKLQTVKDKASILLYSFKMFLFALLFEQYLLGQYIELFKIRKKIKRYPSKSV